MNPHLWNKLSERYETDVLSVYDRDRDRAVHRAVAEAARKIPAEGYSRAMDLGCGVGKFIPLLARHFSSVFACDFSQEALKRARTRCAGLPNVHIHLVDLSHDPIPVEPADWVMCINVLIMPDFDARRRAWRTVCNQVAHDGRLALVVPALESIWMEQHHVREDHLDKGLSCEESLRKSLPDDSSLLDMHQGVYRLEDCRTKHYSREELEHLLLSHELRDVEINRLVYTDNSGGPSPSWDWFALAVRS